MPLPNKIEKEMDRIFIDLFELDTEDGEDSIFMWVLNDMVSMHGMDTIVLWPREDLHIRGLILLIHLAVEVKSLQFYLKHLQEKELFLIDVSLDYSSIDESFFRKFINDATAIHQIRSGMETRTVPLP